MVEAAITHKPAPCDREDGLQEHETHTHDDDGRVCAWEQGEWITVNPNSEPVEAVPEPIDQKKVGFYGKYMVRRADRRDEAGGDRVEAAPHYFVLDPIFDPMSRPVMALYAILAREHGYEKLADDIEGNLRVLAKLQAEAMDSQADPDSESRSLRAIATWTYTADMSEYIKGFGERVGADTMAAQDVARVEQGYVTVTDMVMDVERVDFRVMPDA